MPARLPTTRPCMPSTSSARCRFRSSTGRTRCSIFSGTRASLTRAEVDHDVLDLRVVRQRLHALLPTEATALVAAERQADTPLDAVGVDPDLARLDRRGQRERLAQI